MTPTSAIRSTSCCGSRRCPTSRHGGRARDRARPGWHIECSPLVLRELGETIDIHGGGRDLVFPHHECETAQSESVTSQPFVRLWFHVGLVGFEGAKMSKSLGNLVFVGDLCKEWDPAAVRLALLGHHYREDWDWHTDEDMPAAAARLALWSSAPDGDGTTGLAAERAALDDDLDTPSPCAPWTRRRRPADPWPTAQGSWASTCRRRRLPGGRAGAGNGLRGWMTMTDCRGRGAPASRPPRSMSIAGALDRGLPDGNRLGCGGPLRGRPTHI